MRNQQIQPNDGRSRIAIISLWAVLIMEIVVIVSGLMQYSLLNNIIDGAIYKDEVLDANDHRQMIVGYLFAFVFVISTITFLMWFQRAYSNLHSKVNNLEHKKYWATLSWFVPVLNLYRPYKIMKELNHETNRVLKKNNIVTNNIYNEQSLIVWWGMWVIGLYLSQFSVNYMSNAYSADTLMTSTLIDIGVGVFGIILTIITIRVVGDYSNSEALLFEVDDAEQLQVEDKRPRYPVSGI